MSVTRTFTITVVSTGYGNKYFIDGVQQPTLNLAESGTYRFDVSDSTMGSHPFKFSTTNDGTHNGGSEYTTGVTTNGTTGQSGAYVQIVVAASAPTLYYYCQYHNAMGGQANTVDPNTYGVFTWNLNAWGSQDGTDVSLTGVSSTSSVGSPTITADINTGWGQDGFGVENWGASGLTVSLTGLELQSNVGEDVNWGIQTWGGNTWGGEYILDVADVMGLTGLSTTSSVGVPTPSSDLTFVPTGVSATSTLGSISLDFSIDVSLTGLSMTSAVGTIDPSDQVMGLTGLSTTSAVGAISIASNPVIDLTGVSATSSVGSLIPADVMGLTGLSTTSAVGSFPAGTPADVMGLTGVSATASISPIGVAPIGYERITCDQSGNYTRVVMGE